MDLLAVAGGKVSLVPLLERERHHSLGEEERVESGWAPTPWAHKSPLGISLLS